MGSDAEESRNGISWHPTCGSLWKELKLYDERLLQKSAMLFVNKSDLECKMHVPAT
jgi:GTPase involved in cell partitioning and DNA repair